MSERKGIDYTITVQPVPGALIAIIAPHAGSIEPKTCHIAQAIAGSEFSLYCFRGCKPSGNHQLHITSHAFDEPQCLKLVSNHTWVVSIHGCNEEGDRVFLGGREKALIADLAAQLKQVGIAAETSGHDYPGTDLRNICNRGKAKAGVQFELSLSFRTSMHIPAFVAAVRSVLSARQNAANPAGSANCRKPAQVRLRCR